MHILEKPFELTALINLRPTWMTYKIGEEVVWPVRGVYHYAQSLLWAKPLWPSHYSSSSPIAWKWEELVPPAEHTHTHIHADMHISKLVHHLHLKIIFQIYVQNKDSTSVYLLEPSWMLGVSDPSWPQNESSLQIQRAYSLSRHWAAKVCNWNLFHLAPWAGCGTKYLSLLPLRVEQVYGESFWLSVVKQTWPQASGCLGMSKLPWVRRLSCEHCY